MRKFVLANVERGAMVHTDGWQGYSFLQAAGYHREIQAHSEESDTLPHFHRVFSNLKTWLKGTYHGGIQAKHLPAYLNEFSFRFNRRFLRGQGFNRALGLAGLSEGPTYEDLYLAGTPGCWHHVVETEAK